MTVEWKILRVNSPSEKQLKAGIFGSANICAIDDDGSIVSYFNNITIRKNGKTGEKFLATPRRSFKKDGEERWQNYYALLPLGDDEALHERQKQRLRAITAEVVNLAETGGTAPPTRPTESTPAKQPAAAPATAIPTQPEPWT